MVRSTILPTRLQAILRSSAGNQTSNKMWQAIQESQLSGKTEAKNSKQTTRLACRIIKETLKRLKYGNNKQTSIYCLFFSKRWCVGKTRFTALVASIMHYRLGYNVAVFADADFPQHSLMKMKSRDFTAMVMENPLKKNGIQTIYFYQQKAYPIMQ